MSTLRDRAIRYGYAIGWRVAGALPPRLVTMTISKVSDRVLRHSGIHVRNLRRNLSAATGRPVTDDLARRAVGPTCGTSTKCSRCRPGHRAR